MSEAAPIVLARSAFTTDRCVSGIDQLADRRRLGRLDLYDVRQVLTQKLMPRSSYHRRVIGVGG